MAAKTEQDRHKQHISFSWISVHVQAPTVSDRLCSEKCITCVKGNAGKFIHNLLVNLYYLLHVYFYTQYIRLRGITTIV